MTYIMDTRTFRTRLPNTAKEMSIGYNGAGQKIESAFPVREFRRSLPNMERMMVSGYSG